MQKREVKKPSLFLSVILPIILFEIIFIAVSIISLAYLTQNTGVAIVVIIISGCIFFLVSFISVFVYLLKYYLYEKSLYSQGKFNILSLVGFIIVAAGYLLNVLINIVIVWIPFIGLIFLIFLAIAIIAGGIVSIVALAGFKQGEKGKGFANIGAFLGIYYSVHLIISIILIVIVWTFAASFIAY